MRVDGVNGHNSIDHQKERECDIKKEASLPHPVYVSIHIYFYKGETAFYTV
jgi:hypothetical protein